jgi:nicotinamidase-related amidase
MEKNARIPRINRGETGLLVIDIQQKLLPQIFEKEQLIAKTVLLAKSAQILGVPVFVTEQYRKGLGLTDPQVAASISPFNPIEKVTFSACSAEGLMPGMRQKNIRTALLCGIETHICVLQTCLDLLEQQFQVFVVADAVSSRTSENVRAGLDRMREAGATIATTEMVLFELLGRAATDEFKQVLALVR